VFLNPFMHRPSYFPYLDLSTFTENLVDYSILSVWSIASLGRTKFDLSVVSDLKTVRTPCCYKQRRTASDTPLICGRTTVDFISGARSFYNASMR